MITFKILALKQVAIPSAAYTAGTNFTVAHGLPYAPQKNACWTQAQTTSADTTDDVQTFGVVSTGATTVTLRPSRTATSVGLLNIWLDYDEGVRNAAR